MAESVFNIATQQNNLTSKVVVGLERIAEVFKVLLWEQAKNTGLSPIQIQLLIFVAYHESSMCNVSHLAREFNVTKPTISDAIKVLDQKKMIVKDYSLPDSRRYLIMLSEIGKQSVKEVENFTQPLEKLFDGIDSKELETTYKTLSNLIFRLNRTGLLSVQRTCFSCRFYDNSSNIHYCNLLESKLQTSEIRLDCPEFNLKV